jgi:hypothetical protein
MQELAELAGLPAARVSALPAAADRLPASLPRKSSFNDLLVLKEPEHGAGVPVFNAGEH